MVDFGHEIECYTEFATAIKALDGATLEGHALDDLYTLYRSLYDVDIVSAEELDRVAAWCDDIESSMGS